MPTTQLINEFTSSDYDNSANQQEIQEVNQESNTIQREEQESPSFPKAFVDAFIKNEAGEGPFTATAHMLATFTVMSPTGTFILAATIHDAATLIGTIPAILKHLGLENYPACINIIKGRETLADLICTGGTVLFTANNIVGFFYPGDVSGKLANILTVVTVGSSALSALVKRFLFKKTLDDLADDTNIADLSAWRKFKIGVASAITSAINFTSPFNVIALGLDFAGKGLITISKPFLVTQFATSFAYGVGKTAICMSKVSVPATKKWDSKEMLAAILFFLPYKFMIAQNAWQDSENDQSTLNSLVIPLIAVSLTIKLLSVLLTASLNSRPRQLIGRNIEANTAETRPLISPNSVKYNGSINSYTSFSLKGFLSTQRNDVSENAGLERTQAKSKSACLPCFGKR